MGWFTPDFLSVSIQSRLVKPVFIPLFYQRFVFFLAMFPDNCVRGLWTYSGVLHFSRLRSGGILNTWANGRTAEFWVHGHELSTETRVTLLSLFFPQIAIGVLTSSRGRATNHFGGLDVAPGCHCRVQWTWCHCWVPL